MTRPLGIFSPLELLQSSASFGLSLSLGAYLIGAYFNRRLQTPIANPMVIANLFIIAFLGILGLDVKRYQSGAQALSILMTPATVALAIPLYRQRAILKRHSPAILAGISLGVLSNAVSLLGLAWLFGLTRGQFATLLPKSVTAAVGMPLADELGGLSALTMGAIIMTGLFGNIVSSKICAWLKIEDPVAVGLAIGTASHALGTVRALEMGEVQGAMSGLAIAIAGVTTVFAAPFFAALAP